MNSDELNRLFGLEDGDSKEDPATALRKHIQLTRAIKGMIEIARCFPDETLYTRVLVTMDLLCDSHIGLLNMVLECMGGE